MAKACNKSEGGQRRRPPRPFDRAKREIFLREIRSGSSREVACAMAEVDRSTVNAWVASGESDTPAHPEHVRFAKAMAKAMGMHLRNAYRRAKKHAKDDPRSAIALLHALDPRFGGPQRVEALRLSNRRASLDNRMAAVRVAVAEAAARGDSSVPGFGLAALLGDDELPLEVRQTVAAWAVRKGFVAVERKDWAA